MMQRRLFRGAFTLLAVIATAAGASAQQLPGRWTAERAMAWEERTGWLVGSNYAPQSAINQLDMWQAESWDPRTIDRELGWAQSLGMNTMRVFLHDLAYKQDPQGFLNRVDELLSIADRHGIRPMLVLFDAVWDPFPRLGPQRQPVPGLHNSGWLQSPGVEILRDTLRHRELEPYVKGVIGRFRDDPRVIAWDLFNEPDNRNPGSYGAFEPVNKGELALALLRRSWQWAREVNPTQPLTAAPWKGDYVDPSQTLPITTFILEKLGRHHLSQLRRPAQPTAAGGGAAAAGAPGALHGVHGAPAGQHLRKHPAVLQAAGRGRVQLGLRQRRVADHLPVGFVAAPLPRRAARLVPRRLPHGRHPVPPGRGAADPIADKRREVTTPDHVEQRGIRRGR
jgi:hypothetical protein